MKKWTFELLSVYLLLAVVQSCLAVAAGMESAEWISLFDGKTLSGWKAAGNSETFSVQDGMIVADGPRSHLFYADPVEGHDFTSFELKVEVKTMPGADSGIYFHTEYRQEGFPLKGYEVQINNAHPGSEVHQELRKTGSLYGVRDVFVSCVKDQMWFTVHIVVKGHRIQVSVNDRLVVDYIGPDGPVRPEPGAGKMLSHGTFALQGFGEGGVVYFRNIRVKPLPDLGRGNDSRSAEEIAYQKRISVFHAVGLPLIDYHVHLKGGLSLEQALEKSRAAGVTYGIAENCGLGFPVTNDEQLKQSFDRLEGRPVFKAMQAEGREWVNMFSPELIAKFDYVFSDALTFHDKQGRRTRLWMANEVHIDDEQQFMDMYVDKIVTILEKEPIDIFVNPTFLPEVIAGRYDELWTQQRMQKVIQAAVGNDVAIEINARYRIPSVKFIKLAKQAGSKFAFGTNNGDSELGRLEYALDVAEQCALTKDDMFFPKPYGKKPVQVKKYQIIR
jgi:histidinol phosphatase-like PHP family hydrolase